MKTKPRVLRAATEAGVHLRGHSISPLFEMRRHSWTQKRWYVWPQNKVIVPIRLPLALVMDRWQITQMGPESSESSSSGAAWPPVTAAAAATGIAAGIGVASSAMFIQIVLKKF